MEGYLASPGAGAMSTSSPGESAGLTARRDARVSEPTQADNDVDREILEFGFELSPNLRSWVRASQPTPAGLLEPHLLIIGRQNRYFETPALPNHHTPATGSPTYKPDPTTRRTASETASETESYAPNQLVHALGLLATDFLDGLSNLIRRPR